MRRPERFRLLPPLVRTAPQVLLPYSSKPMLFAAPEPELFPPAKKLSIDARKLREVYARYACFAQAIPTFRSREFAKVVKEAGLMSPTFNSKWARYYVHTHLCSHLHHSRAHAFVGGVVRAPHHTARHRRLFFSSLL